MDSAIKRQSDNNGRKVYKIRLGNRQNKIETEKDVIKHVLFFVFEL